MLKRQINFKIQKYDKNKNTKQHKKRVRGKKIKLKKLKRYTKKIYLKHKINQSSIYSEPRQYLQIYHQKK